MSHKIENIDTIFIQEGFEREISSLTRNATHEIKAI